MGICSGTEGKDVRTEESKGIDLDLKKARKIAKYRIKVLILGTSASGKSTIVKQVRLQYGTGFSSHERENFRDIVHLNIFTGIKYLIDRAEQLSYKILRKNKKAKASLLAANLYDPGASRTTLLEACKTLWSDQGIQKCFEQRCEDPNALHLKYWMDNVIDKLIEKDDWMPTDDDIIFARQRTTGIVEAKFQQKQYEWLLVDVGGQKTERRKWIHCFDGMTAVIYVAASNEWDIPSEETEGATKMQESLGVWRQHVNSPAFAETCIILFLNKMDLLNEKLAVVDLQETFSEYTGGADGKMALEFIKNQYLDAVDRDGHPASIYVHPTCAIDKEQIRALFEELYLIFYFIADQGDY
mmetsp:Transcript_23970/g.26607  ORF Transcript_23970/g.26607 Transcript_23970/m.26607 type:complete len:355 (-) Transcript_23970:229-1293(-)